MVSPEPPGRTTCCSQHGLRLPPSGSKESFASPCRNSPSEAPCLAQPDPSSMAPGQQREDKRDHQTVPFGLCNE